MGFPDTSTQNRILSTVGSLYTMFASFSSVSSLHIVLHVQLISPHNRDETVNWASNLSASDVHAKKAQLLTAIRIGLPTDGAVTSLFGEGWPGSIAKLVVNNLTVATVVDKCTTPKHSDPGRSFLSSIAADIITKGILKMDRQRETRPYIERLCLYSFSSFIGSYAARSYWKT